MNVCVCWQFHGILDGSGEGLDECMCVLAVSRDT